MRAPTQTGDWHLFSPESLAAGGAAGDGNWPLNGENGGRRFSTSAFVWEAHSAPASVVGGVYPRMYADWAALAAGVAVVGRQLAANDTSTPLGSAGARGVVSTRVTDPLVRQLCAARRANSSSPGARDDWGDTRCDFYQDVTWGAPESGHAFLAFAKGLLGLRVLASGHVGLMGSVSPAPVSGAFLPWVFSARAPSGWPPDAQAVVVVGLAAAGGTVDLACDVPGGVVAECSVELASPGSAAQRLRAGGAAGGGALWDAAMGGGAPGAPGKGASARLGRLYRPIDLARAQYSSRSI